jgi:hypothetical protein
MLSSNKKSTVELFKLLKNKKKILFSDVVKTAMQLRDGMRGMVIRKIIIFLIYLI